MGKWFIIGGAIMLIIGLALTYAPWMVNWFGNLPGDINIKNENSQVFIPITSMLIVSVLISVIMWLVRQ